MRAINANYFMKGIGGLDVVRATELVSTWVDPVCTSIAKSSDDRQRYISRAVMNAACEMKYRIFLLYYIDVTIILCYTT